MHASANSDLGARAVVYGLALAWCFFGVAIISDTFMVAIEGMTLTTAGAPRTALSVSCCVAADAMETSPDARSD